MTNHSVFKSNKIGTQVEGLSDRSKKANVSVIKEMMYLAAQEVKKGREIVSLAVGIPYYQMPAYIKKGIIKVLGEDRTIDKYTLLTGMPKLRQLIAKKASQDLNMDVSEEEILVTPGSMAALLYTMLTLINRNDEVIVFSPYFSSYGEQIALAEGVPVDVPLIEPSKKSGSWKIDFDLLKKKITKKTKAVLVCNPSNPNGAFLEKTDLLKLADVIHENNLYLVTDEVYDFLIYDDQEYFNIASVKKLWPKVIRCCSFSKKYGMTGWRLGYIQTNKDLLLNILKVHDATIVCAPHISQEAGFIALSGSSPELEENRKQLEKNRNLICERLDRLPDLFSYTIPRGGYYIFPKYKLRVKSIDMAKRLLYEAGVAAVPGIGFGPVGEYHLRFSFGGFTEEINRAFDKIDKWWQVQKNYEK